MEVGYTHTDRRGFGAAENYYSNRLKGRPSVLREISFKSLINSETKLAGVGVRRQRGGRGRESSCVCWAPCGPAEVNEEPHSSVEDGGLHLNVQLKWH